VRPHGLGGRVVIEMVSNRPERTMPGSRLSWRGGEVEVREASRLSSGGGRDRWLVALEGVSDREAAEALRGEELWAEPLTQPGALWVHELVGSTVVMPGDVEIGRVAALQEGVSADLLVLEDGRLIPLTFLISAGGGRVMVELPAGLLDL
jgi:16S rRNA processing protein RimM